MDSNPAAFVDYRGLVATPSGLVVNCFVCYPNNQGCPNATFFTAILSNGAWTVYQLPQVDWSTHCYMDGIMGGIIYSKGESNDLIAFQPSSGSIIFSGPLGVTIDTLSCGGTTDLMLGLGENLYLLSTADGRVLSQVWFSFGRRNITTVVEIA